jgi:hypothetical protein
MGIKFDKLVDETTSTKDEHEETLRQSISRELRINLRDAVNEGLRELQILQNEEGYGKKYVKRF